MKKLIVPLVILMVISFAARLAQAGEKAQPCTVAIIIDTSPTGYWSEIRAAAGNIYKSSAAGDTILVFTVRGKTTRLRFSSIRQREDYEFDDFCSIIKNISPDWLLHADMFSSVAGPVYQKLLQHSGPEGRAMIIIITEGNLGRRQAQGICKFADDIRTAHNWPLLITGRIDKTPKQLLIAAGQGRLCWCNLKAAVDGVSANKWMQHAKRAATGALEKVTGPAAAPKAERSKKEPSRKSSLRSKSRLRDRKSGAFSKGDKNIASVPMHRSTKKAIAAPAVPRKTQSHLKTKPKSSQPSKTPIFKRRALLPLLLVGGVSIPFILALLLISSWLKARAFQEKVQAPLESVQQQQDEPRILMVRANGRLHRIGDLRRFKGFGIGAAADNTIRLSDEAVAPRHLRFFRRRRKLFLRNLAKDPVVANGQELRPHRQFQLTLPAVLTIAQGITIYLFLQKTRSVKSEKLEENNHAETS